MNPKVLWIAGGVAAVIAVAVIVPRAVAWYRGRETGAGFDMGLLRTNSLSGGYVKPPPPKPPPHVYKPKGFTNDIYAKGYHNV